VWKCDLYFLLQYYYILIKLIIYLLHIILLYTVAPKVF